MFKEARQETGAVMLEFAMVVAGLVFGIILFVDIAGSLNEYLKLAQTVGEGVKLASRMPGLQENLYTDLDRNSTLVADCAASPTAALPCSHLEIHQRVRFMLDNTAYMLDPVLTEIKSQLTRDPLATPTNVVRVQVSSRYRGIVLFNLPLVIVLEGPYLFN